MAYVKLSEEIKKIDEYGDAILFSKQVKYMSDDFRTHFKDEHELREAFDYFNECALKDESFGINFAVLISSKVFDAMNIGNVKMRNEALNILQKNFQNNDLYKKESIQKFYNSISLLGEFYCRLRIGDKPIHILGQSLFELLVNELQNELENCKIDTSHNLSAEFAKLVLTQVTLNGQTAKREHHNELEQLLMSIRKCLIEMSGMKSKTRAFLLMILDLYYSNFDNGASQLQQFYASYFIMEDEPVLEVQSKKVPLTMNQKIQTEPLIVITTKNVTDKPKAVVEPSKPYELPSKSHVNSEEYQQPRPVSCNSSESESWERFRAGPPVFVKRSLNNLTKSPNGSSDNDSPNGNGVISTSPTDQFNKFNPSEISDRVRNTKIGRIYPHPIKRESKSGENSSSEEEVAKLSKANVTAHQLACCISTTPTKTLPSKSSPSDHLDIKTLQIEDKNGIAQHLKPLNDYDSTIRNKLNYTKAYLREENVENLTWDPTNFEEEDDTSPVTNPYSQSFLKFLEN